eukprot:m.20299 g.20299  ORF g.20299 m.20299 type:complete len:1179 (-) comp8139_c0_seq1:214-3750(-)
MERKLTKRVASVVNPLDPIEDTATFMRDIRRRSTTRTAMMGTLNLFSGRIQGFQPFQFNLRNAKLTYYREDEELSDQVHRMSIDVQNVLLYETSDRNLSNEFELLTSTKQLLKLQANTRVDMENWCSAIRLASLDFDKERLAVDHKWMYTKAINAPTCANCAEPCGGHGTRHLICGVCHTNVHRRCAALFQHSCKWCTYMTVPEEYRVIGETTGAPLAIGHQWITRPTASKKCVVCRKKPGRDAASCIWCKRIVHPGCRVNLPFKCPMAPPTRDSCGPLSIINPLDISQQLSTFANISVEEGFRVSVPAHLDPLIVFVNTKSGSNDGVSILRIMKHVLNPIQVFDLSHGGPAAGLKLLQDRKTFRALGCGGDGTIGWILHEADKLDIRNCQLAVMPLGTGNDLARVLGWGGAFDDPSIDAINAYLQDVSRAKVEFLDRWTVSLETPDPTLSLAAQDEADEETAQASPQPVDAPASAASAAPAAPAPDGEDEGVSTRHRKSRHKRGISRKASTAEKLMTKKNQVFAQHKTAMECLGQLLQCLVQYRDYFDKTAAQPRPAHSRRASAIDLTSLAAPGQAGASSAAADPSEDEDGQSSVPAMSRKASTAVLELVIQWDDLTDIVARARNELVELKHLAVRSTGFARSLQAVLDHCMSLFSRLEKHIGAYSAYRDTLESVQEPLVVDSLISMVEALLSSLSDVFATQQPRRRSIKPDAASGRVISVLNNYCGIGLDAKIAYDFDKLRTEHPEKCQSRTKNKMWYGIKGLREVFKPTCSNLQDRIKLYCDGVEMQLPRCEGLVILNIPSYMGGADLWGNVRDNDPNFSPQSFSDGLLDVLVMTGAFQMAMSKGFGLNPRKLCQAKRITIRLLAGDPIPMQVDGEPWMQEADRLIHINHHSRVQLLAHDSRFSDLYDSWGPTEEAEPDSTVADDLFEALYATYKAVKRLKRIPTHIFSLIDTSRFTSAVYDDATSAKYRQRFLFHRAAAAQLLVAALNKEWHLFDPQVLHKGDLELLETSLDHLQLILSRFEILADTTLLDDAMEKFATAEFKKTMRHKHHERQRTRFKKRAVALGAVDGDGDTVSLDSVSSASPSVEKKEKDKGKGKKKGKEKGASPCPSQDASAAEPSATSVMPDVDGGNHSTDANGTAATKAEATLLPGPSQIQVAPAVSEEKVEDVSLSP